VYRKIIPYIDLPFRHVCACKRDREIQGVCGVRVYVCVYVLSYRPHVATGVRYLRKRESERECLCLCACVCVCICPVVSTSCCDRCALFEKKRERERVFVSVCVCVSCQECVCVCVISYPSLNLKPKTVDSKPSRRRMKDYQLPNSKPRTKTLNPKL